MNGCGIDHCPTHAERLLQGNCCTIDKNRRILIETFHAKPLAIAVFINISPATQTVFLRASLAGTLGISTSSASTKQENLLNTGEMNTTTGDHIPQLGT